MVKLKKTKIIFYCALVISHVLTCTSSGKLKSNSESPNYVVENISYSFLPKLFGPLSSNAPLDPLFSRKILLTIKIRILSENWSLQKFYIDYENIKERHLNNKEIEVVEKTLYEQYGPGETFEKNPVKVIPIIPIFKKRKGSQSSYSKDVKFHWGGLGLNYVVVRVGSEELLIHWFRVN